VEWVAPPPVAPIVIVLVPNVAVDVAENETVTVHVGLHGLFVKVAATPLGRPVAENVMGDVVPLTSVAVIDDDGLDAPWTTVRLFGAGAESEKSKAGAATVNDRVVEWVVVPAAALIVTVTVPIVAVPVAENDTVTVQVGLHGLFVKVAVTPEGNADVENVTGVVVPVTRVAVIDDVGLDAP